MSDDTPINLRPYRLPIPKGGTPAHLHTAIDAHREQNKKFSMDLYARVKAQAIADGSPTIPWKEPAAKGQPSFWLR